MTIRHDCTPRQIGHSYDTELGASAQLDDQPEDEAAGGEVPDIPLSAPPGEADLIAEVALLREQMARLVERLDGMET